MYGIYADSWGIYGILMVNVTMIMAYIRIRHGYIDLLDWFKANLKQKQSIKSREIWGVPVDFPGNQSNK